MKFLLSTFLAIALTCQWLAAQERSQNWPQWRGPQGTGFAPNSRPPLDWNEQENIRWKIKLPGKGHSTPVVWKDTLFMTSAIPVGEALPAKFSGRPGAHDNLPVTHEHQFVLIAINRTDGTIRWKKMLRRQLPHEGAHQSGSLASGSPITDGQHVFACFGSYGLFCLDFDGNVIWEKDFGRMHTKHGHGEGSSPALDGGTLVVNWDHEEDSFVIALNKSTGKTIWKAERDEVTSWSSPIIVNHQGQRQAIVAGTSRVRGYDLASGDVIWQCGGLSANVVATPVYQDGVLYVGSSYDARAMLAIDLAGATGDLTGSKHVLWRRTQRTPYVPSMLLYEDTLYFLTHYQGILSRVTAKTGEEKTGPMRLDRFREIYASPVGANGHIYVTDREGKTLVISHSDPPRAVALNQLDDEFNASAAIVDDEIFLRGKRFLYCIAKHR